MHLLPLLTQYLLINKIQHGSFGSLGFDDDNYYSAGSDDFRAYIWKVASLNELTEQRQQISADDWASQEFPGVIGKLFQGVTFFSDVLISIQAFTEGIWSPRYVPVELSTPFCRLTGKFIFSLSSSVVWINLLFDRP